MMRVTWLPGVLRAAGLTVIESPGWQGRGRPLERVDGVVLHGFGVHPLDPARADAVLRDGRADLPGPLAQLGLDRDGRWRVIADGRCNHNGYGLWKNNSIGVEAYGRDTWTVVQLDSWQRGTAAILRHLGYSTDRVKGHRETDPDRKPDPINVDLDAFRRRVAAHLTTGDDEVTDENIAKIVRGVLDALADDEHEVAANRLRKAAHAAQHLHDNAGLTD